MIPVICNGINPANGERCGREYTRGGPDNARAAGWHIGILPSGERDAMCPRCARPDPALLKLCRELEGAWIRLRRGYACRNAEIAVRAGEVRATWPG
jgi:hypothetical protein